VRRKRHLSELATQATQLPVYERYLQALGVDRQSQIDIMRRAWRAALEGPYPMSRPDIVVAAHAALGRPLVPTAPMPDKHFSFTGLASHTVSDARMIGLATAHMVGSVLAIAPHFGTGLGRYIRDIVRDHKPVKEAWEDLANATYSDWRGIAAGGRDFGSAIHDIRDRHFSTALVDAIRGLDEVTSAPAFNTVLLLAMLVPGVAEVVLPARAAALARVGGTSALRVGGGAWISDALAHLLFPPESISQLESHRGHWGVGKLVHELGSSFVTGLYEHPLLSLMEAAPAGHVALAKPSATLAVTAAEAREGQIRQALDWLAKTRQRVPEDPRLQATFKPIRIPRPILENLRSLLSQDIPERVDPVRDPAEIDRIVSRLNSERLLLHQMQAEARPIAFHSPLIEGVFKGLFDRNPALVRTWAEVARAKKEFLDDPSPDNWRRYLTAGDPVLRPVVRMLQNYQHGIIQGSVTSLLDAVRLRRGVRAAITRMGADVLAKDTRRAVVAAEKQRDDIVRNFAASQAYERLARVPEETRTEVSRLIDQGKIEEAINRFDEETVNTVYQAIKAGELLGRKLLVGQDGETQLLSEFYDPISARTYLFRPETVRSLSRKLAALTTSTQRLSAITTQVHPELFEALKGLVNAGVLSQEVLTAAALPEGVREAILAATQRLEGLQEGALGREALNAMANASEINGRIGVALEHIGKGLEAYANQGVLSLIQAESATREAANSAAAWAFQVKRDATALTTVVRQSIDKRIDEVKERIETIQAQRQRVTKAYRASQAALSTEIARVRGRLTSARRSLERISPRTRKPALLARRRELRARISELEASLNDALARQERLRIWRSAITQMRHLEQQGADLLSRLQSLRDQIGPDRNFTRFAVAAQRYSETLRKLAEEVAKVKRAAPRRDPARVIEQLKARVTAETQRASQAFVSSVTEALNSVIHTRELAAIAFREQALGLDPLLSVVTTDVEAAMREGIIDPNLFGARARVEGLTRQATEALSRVPPDVMVAVAARNLAEVLKTATKKGSGWIMARTAVQLLKLRQARKTADLAQKWMKAAERISDIPRGQAAARALAYFFRAFAKPVATNMTFASALLRTRGDYEKALQDYLKALLPRKTEIGARQARATVVAEASQFADVLHMETLRAAIDRQYESVLRGGAMEPKTLNLRQFAVFRDFRQQFGDRTPTREEMLQFMSRYDVTAPIARALEHADIDAMEAMRALRKWVTDHSSPKTAERVLKDVKDTHEQIVNEVHEALVSAFANGQLPVWHKSVPESERDEALTVPHLFRMTRSAVEGGITRPKPSPGVEPTVDDPLIYVTKGVVDAASTRAWIQLIEDKFLPYARTGKDIAEEWRQAKANAVIPADMTLTEYARTHYKAVTISGIFAPQEFVEDDVNQTGTAEQIWKEGGRVYIRTSDARALRSFQDVLAASEAPRLAFLRKGMRFFKTNLFFLSPTFLAHILSGVVLVALSRQGAEALGRIPRAVAQVLRGEVPPEFNRFSRSPTDEMIEQYRDIEVGRMVGGTLPLLMRRLGAPFVKLNRFWMEKVIGTIIDSYRLATYQAELDALRAAGIDERAAHVQALRHVAEVLGDLNDLSAPERAIAAYVIPFLHWTRHILEFLLLSPDRSPVGAAIISAYTSQFFNRWTWQYNPSLAYLAMIGRPDNRGFQEVVRWANFDPLRLPYSLFTTVGFLSSLSPPVQAVLAATTPQVFKGSPLGDTVLTAPETMDALSGTLSSGSRFNPVVFAEAYAPRPLELLAQIGNRNSYYYYLQQTNPSRARSYLFEALGFPWVPYRLDLHDEAIRRELNAYHALRNQVEAALNQPDFNAPEWDQVMQYPWVPLAYGHTTSGWWVRPQWLKEYALQLVIENGFRPGQVAPSQLIVVPPAPLF
jgi:hypothetical protein